jgi:hypothetical protein
MNRRLQMGFRKSLFIVAGALTVGGVCILGPSYGGEKSMSPITLELKVEPVKKGVRSPTMKATYNWDGFIVHQMATNKGKTPVVLINQFRTSNPTNFEIYDFKEKKPVNRMSQYAAVGNMGPISKSDLRLITIKPNETVELDTLIISHNEKTMAWDAYSHHWNWKDIGHKKSNMKVSIASHYELDDVTKGNYQKYYPGTDNLISDRIESASIGLDLNAIENKPSKNDAVQITLTLLDNLKIQAELKNTTESILTAECKPGHTFDLILQNVKTKEKLIPFDRRNVITTPGNQQLNRVIKLDPSQTVQVGQSQLVKNKNGSYRLEWGLQTYQHIPKGTYFCSVHADMTAGRYLPNRATASSKETDVWSGLLTSNEVLIELK